MKKKLFGNTRSLIRFSKIPDVVFLMSILIASYQSATSNAIKSKVQDSVALP